MKIDRLMGIVVYLLNHGRTSAQKLAEEFEVSSRTIMRDLESLRDLMRTLTLSRLCWQSWLFSL